MLRVTVSRPTVLFLTISIWLAASLASADHVELLSGASVDGQIEARDDKSVTVSREMSGRTFTREYPLSRIHAITSAGRREVINPLPSQSGSSTAGGSGTSTAASAGGLRTRAQVEALIKAEGSTPPDWWDSVSLNYPDTLDLSWPQPPPTKGWNSKKNVGQYYWDVIHQNPSKWREGVKLAHHLMTVNQRNTVVRRRAMEKIAALYQTFLEDYARAAFWWRAAGTDRDTRNPQTVKLAECYWRLGNKQMAMDHLNRSILTFSSVKLMADMGETSRALKVLQTATQGQSAHVAYLSMGDIYRQLGQYDKAIPCYQRVLSLIPAGQKQGHGERYRRRAQINIDAIKYYDALDLSRVADGTYKSSSLGYEAQVSIEVVVKSGVIESVRVTGHREKQFYSSITATPAAIVRMQGVKGVDAVTGATITSEAIMNATAKALAGGMK